jgi:large subunit ribosomal protein L10
MARPEKVAAVEEIKERLESAEAVFITEYRGLTVGQQQTLRRSLREADAEYKVFKMTLARRAAKEAGFSELLVWLEGPTAIAFTSGDPVPTAKSLKEFSESNDRLVLKGGMLSGATLDAEAVRRLADLEPREVLLAKLAGVLSAPMSKLAGLMSAILRQPVSAMQQLLEKKEADPEARAPVAADITETDVATPGAADEVAEETAVDEPEAAEAATEVPEPAGEEPAGDEPGDAASEAAAVTEDEAAANARPADDDASADEESEK